MQCYKLKALLKEKRQERAQHEDNKDFQRQAGISTSNAVFQVEVKPPFNPNIDRITRYVNNFKYGEKELKLDSNNMIQGVLPSKQNMLFLCDTGAIKTLISMSTIGNSRYLSSLPKLTKCADFEIANN